MYNSTIQEVITYSPIISLSNYNKISMVTVNERKNDKLKQNKSSVNYSANFSVAG